MVQERTTDEWSEKWEHCITKDPKKIPNKGVLQAINMASSQKALAEMLHISQPAVHLLLYKNCPVKRAIQIERLFNIPKEVTRPDVFVKGE